MTTAELDEEWRYRYAERIGMMVGALPPTKKQEKIAKDEADEVWKTLQKESE